MEQKKTGRSLNNTDTKMERLVRGLNLLADDSKHKNSRDYREIMKVLSLFGYASADEIMYHLNLDKKQDVINRLWYLEVRGRLIKRFPSETIPQSFYCLTALGREIILKHFRISDFVSSFVPSAYNLMWQKHHRLLIKVWSALVKCWGEKLTGWVSEEQLKKELYGKQARVFDGEFFLQVFKTYQQETDGSWGKEVFTKSGHELLRCGLELETSLKSPKRYEKQINDLVNYLSGKKFSTIFFIYTTETIKDRLRSHLLNHYLCGADAVFIELNNLLSLKGEAEVEGYRDGRKIALREIK